jgi:hypothetical protein
MNFHKLVVTRACSIHYVIELCKGALTIPPAKFALCPIQLIEELGWRALVLGSFLV